MPHNVVLFGPPGAGKSTFAAALGNAVEADPVAMDLLRETKTKRFGFSASRAERLFRTGGAPQFHAYASRFDDLLLPELLQKRKVVIDTSGGSLSHSNVCKASPDNLIVLMLPSRRYWRKAFSTRSESGSWLESGGADINERLFDLALDASNSADMVVDMENRVEWRRGQIKCQEYLETIR